MPVAPRATLSESGVDLSGSRLAGLHNVPSATWYCMARAGESWELFAVLGNEVHVCERVFGHARACLDVMYVCA